MSTASDNWLPRHRITVDEYYRMAEVGLLAHDARVELIEGEIIDMPPIGSTHASVVMTLNKELARVIGDHALLSVQGPARLSQRSEPQPDLMLLKPREDFYRAGHPSAADVLLLIEVSDTTLRYDRDVKAALYARHGIPEVWIIDVRGGQVHCMREPKDGAYGSVTDIWGKRVSLAALNQITVDLSVLNF